MSQISATDTYYDEDFGDEALDRCGGPRMCTGIGPGIDNA